MAEEEKTQETHEEAIARLRQEAEHLRTNGTIQEWVAKNRELMNYGKTQENPEATAIGNGDPVDAPTVATNPFAFLNEETQTQDSQTATAPTESSYDKYTDMDGKVHTTAMALEYNIPMASKDGMGARDHLASLTPEQMASELSIHELNDINTLTQSGKLDIGKLSIDQKGLDQLIANATKAQEAVANDKAPLWGDPVQATDTSLETPLRVPDGFKIPVIDAAYAPPAPPATEAAATSKESSLAGITSNATFSVDENLNLNDVTTSFTPNILDQSNERTLD